MAAVSRARDLALEIRLDPRGLEPLIYGTMMRALGGELAAARAILRWADEGMAPELGRFDHFTGAHQREL